MVNYRIDRVDIEPTGTPSRSAWTFAGRMVKGLEHRYDVTDRNFTSRNKWSFVVRVPHDAHGRIEVRPVATPSDRTYAGLDRRSITFMRATRPGYTAFRYCPLALADPSGESSRVIAKASEKAHLPPWLRSLGRRLKKKDTVRTTRGTDGGLLVALVRPDDHQFMIAMFMATKAWVLKRGFTL
jgi:hypothetical protein